MAAIQCAGLLLRSRGGKTGSGDNRFDVFGPGGRLVSSQAVNRTATFVFYVGDRYYGVLTAVVEGPASGGYSFTSMLPVHIVRLLAPDLEQRVAPGIATAPVAAGPATAPPVAASRPVDDRLSVEVRSRSSGPPRRPVMRGF